MKHYSVYSNPAHQVEYIGEIPPATFTKEFVDNQGYSWYNSVSMSPDGTRIVTASENGTISIWDATSSKIIMGPLEGHSASVFSVTYSPDGKYIISGSFDSTIRVWDASNGELIRSPLKGHTEGVSSVAISSNGKFIASGSFDKTVRLWDMEKGSSVSEPFVGHTDRVYSVSISSEVLLMVSGSRDKSIIVWDIQSMKMKFQPLKKHAGIVNSVAFSPSGENIISGSDDGVIYIWDSSSGDIIHELFNVATSKITYVTYTPNGQHILSGCSNGMVHMGNKLDIIAPPRRLELEAHSGWIADISFAQDNARFVTYAYDKKTRIWDLTDNVFDTKPSELQTGMIRCIDISPSGQYIVSGSNNKTVCIWNSTSGKLVSGPWQGHDFWIASVAFSPDETRIASGSVDFTIRLWDAITGDFTSLTGHEGAVLSVVFSPSGKHIASGSRDRKIRIWDVQTCKPFLKPFEGHEDDIQSIVYSLDGTKIVSGSLDTTVRIWDSTNGELLSVLKGCTFGIHCVAISPDGSLIASGSGDLIDEKSGEILAWDAKSGKVVWGTSERHKKKVLSIRFSPDGKWLLSGSRDTTICIMDAVTGDLFRIFRGHTGPVNSVCFLPGSGDFVSSSDDGTLRSWTLNDKPDDIEWQQRNKDGWVIGKNGELLIWLPPDLCVTHPTPGTVAIFNQPFRTQLKLTDCFLGEEWTKCLPQYIT